MSFNSILKNIITVSVGIEHAAAPLVSLAFPQFSPAIVAIDGIVLRLQSAIVTAESTAETVAAYPKDPGWIKSQAVIADFNAGLDLTQSALALKGQKLIYDSAALQASIDAQVAAYNAFAKLKGSFQVVPV